MIRKPDFIYIGLKRSGSTFLRGYFEGHPDIVWQRKASAFLMHDPAFHGGQADVRHEAPAGAAFVEVNELLATGLMMGAGNAFEANRFRPGSSLAESGCRADPAAVAGRVKETFPEARIIFFLRNQVDWLRTHYRVFIGELPPGRHGFTDFLMTPEGQLVHNGGFYHRTVAAYYDLFGRANVHVALFEDIRDDESGTLRSLCGFLGVPAVPYDPQFRRYNRGPSNLAVKLKTWCAAIGISGKQLAALGPLARLGRALLPPSRAAADPLSRADRDGLAAAYADSNRETARLIGRDLQAAGYPW